jgi:D-glycero-alpha-D-manno-heptose-7-phosphate kinase
VKVIFNVNVVLDVYATERTRLRKAMRKAGLQEVRFRFDFEGTKILTMD